MNTIRKFVPFLVVGIISTFLTVGVMYLFSSKNNNGFFSSNENSGYFTSSNLAPNYRFAANGSGTDFTVAADKTVNSVVSVKNFSSNTQQSANVFDFFFGQGDDMFQQGRPQMPKNTPSGTGSGVIISKDGYIITNNHVIDRAEKIEVTLNNQQTYTAKLVGKDPSTDIALIKIDEDNLPFLNFYDSDQVKVGEWVLAVGNPFGLNSTVTAGIISAKGRSINILQKNAKNPIESFIQTDAAINPGNSGGALVNTNGDLIGINSAISSHTGSYEGYGFAVPSNIAKKIVEDIKQYGIVQRGYIGIVPLDLSDEMTLNMYNQKNNTNYKTQEGVLVTGLSADGSAYDAGIEEGDIITNIDGRKIVNYAALSSAIASKRPGDKINVVIKRNGSTKNYTLELRDIKGKTSLRSKEDLTVSEIIGADFQALTDEQKTNFGLDSGVLVSNIEADGKLANIGINKNYIILEVNGKKVNNQKDIEKILSKFKGNVSLKFVDRYGRIYQKGFQM